MCDVCVSEPADVQAPRLVKVFEDGTALLRLRPGRHQSITKYFVVVVPDIVSRLRDPSDFRLDEVFIPPCIGGGEEGPANPRPHGNNH